jgi:nicotinamidase-related amidase
MRKIFSVMLVVGALALLAGCTVTDKDDDMMDSEKTMMMMDSEKPMMTMAAMDSVVDNWSHIHAPAAPMLESVEIDPATTALLVLDVEQRTVPSRPRAVAIVPNIMHMVDWARDNDVLVVYSTTPGVSTATILPEVMPKMGEVVVAASVDKYYGTALEATLRAHGIKTVIVTGVAAEGAVLGTTIGSVVRGFKVILPVDCMASSEPFYEQYVIVHVLNAPGTIGNVTVTKMDMITKKGM